MLEELKVTRKVISTLEWFKEHQPVEAFDPKNGPSLTYVRKLVKAGLIQTSKNLIPHPKLDVGVASFKLSKTGRKLLKER